MQASDSQPWYALSMCIQWHQWLFLVNPLVLSHRYKVIINRWSAGIRTRFWNPPSWTSPFAVSRTTPAEPSLRPSSRLRRRPSLRRRKAGRHKQVNLRISWSCQSRSIGTSLLGCYTAAIPKGDLNDCWTARVEFENKKFDLVLAASCNKKIQGQSRGQEFGVVLQRQDIE